MDLAFDYRELSNRVGRPARPKLAECRSALSSITDPKEAWERLASEAIIPLEWLASSQRCFVESSIIACSDCKGEQLSQYCLKCNSQRRFFDRESWKNPREVPVDVRECMVFGADPAGVMTAEALALELYRALEPVGFSAVNPKFVWRVGTVTTERGQMLVPADILPYVEPELQKKVFTDAFGMRAPEGAVLLMARVGWYFEYLRTLSARTAEQEAKMRAYRFALEIVRVGYTVDWVEGDCVYLLSGPLR